MKCPVCNVDLAPAAREGVEIDFCSRCRGVWLDRGELDKIIEYSSRAYPSLDDSDEYPAYRGGPHRGHEGYHGGHPHGKKKGFLSRFFDWD